MSETYGQRIKRLRPDLYDAWRGGMVCSIPGVAQYSVVGSICDFDYPGMYASHAHANCTQCGASGMDTALKQHKHYQTFVIVCAYCGSPR